VMISSSFPPIGRAMANTFCISAVRPEPRRFGLFPSKAIASPSRSYPPRPRHHVSAPLFLRTADG